MKPLYETYRPKSWGEVVGQDEALKKLDCIRRRGGLAGYVYWVTGASGTGKTTIARLIAEEVGDDWTTIEIDGSDLDMATVRYRRISPGDSKHGLDAQVPAVEAYFNLLKANEPELNWGEWFADNHESAFKKQFLERPEARRLHTSLRRGDHIIFAKFDRAFRQARDAHNMLAMWQERGIHVHFADLRVDTNTAHGRLFLSLLAAMAQWESEVTSERCKATVAYLKSKGRPHNHAPMGMKTVGKQGKKKYAWDHDTRRVMKTIVKLHDEYGWEFLKISDWLEEKQAAKEDRRPHPPSGPRAWKVDRCRKAYRAEKKYQAEEQGQPPPMDNGNGQG